MRRNIRGSTPLHTAAWHGQVEVADLLLETGEDVNVTDNDGDSGLWNAASNGKLGMVAFLIERGAFVDQVRSWAFAIFLFTETKGSLKLMCM